MHRDLAHMVKGYNGLTSVASTGAEEITGEIIDTIDFESGVVIATATAWTAGELVVGSILESDSDDMSDSTELTELQIIDDTGVGVSEVGTKHVGFVRTKRYIQPVFETIGASVGLTVQGTVVLGHKNTTVEV